LGNKIRGLPDATDPLFKASVYFLLQLTFVFVVQFFFPTFCGMEKSPYHTIYPAALLLEQPADGAPCKMDAQLDPFFDRECGMLPFLDEPGCMAAVVLYLLYYSHNRGFITMIFEYRREGSA
jgi:hypothetical protein